MRNVMLVTLGVPREALVNSAWLVGVGVTLAAAPVDLLRLGSAPRSRLLRELRALIATDRRRDRLNKHPEYVSTTELQEQT